MKHQAKLNSVFFIAFILLINSCALINKTPKDYSSLEIKEIKIYYTPIKYRLTRGIYAPEIKVKSIYKIKIKETQSISVSKVYRVSEHLDKLNYIYEYEEDKLIVRAKIIFKVKGGRDIIVYITEAETIGFKGKIYERHPFFLSLLKIYCDD